MAETKELTLAEHDNHLKKTILEVRALREEVGALKCAIEDTKSAMEDIAYQMSILVAELC